MSTNEARLPRRRILEIFFWSVGLLLLAFYVTTRARQRAVAAREVRDFHETRNVQSAASAPSAASLPRQEPRPGWRPLSWGAPDQSLWSPVRVRAWESGPQPSSGHALAVLRIPHPSRCPVFEGTDDATLDLGLGHVEGTAGLDAPGNVALAGHRDGFFRGLKDVGAGDEIDMETQTGMRRYLVKDIVIVKPDDVWVLDDNSAALTDRDLLPLLLHGLRPQRYIVRASEQPRTP